MQKIIFSYKLHLSLKCSCRISEGISRIRDQLTRIYLLICNYFWERKEGTEKQNREKHKFNQVVAAPNAHLKKKLLK